MFFGSRLARKKKVVNSQYLPNVISSNVGEIKTPWSHLPYFYTKSCFYCSVSKILHLAQWSPPDQTVQILFLLFVLLPSLRKPNSRFFAPYSYSYKIFYPIFSLPFPMSLTTQTLYATYLILSLPLQTPYVSNLLIHRILLWYSIQWPRLIMQSDKHI